MTEEVAHTVWAAEQLGGVIEIEQKDIDSLNDRYQNVYGQH
jgi:L-ribulose-5-phosphate 4-epimerase